MRLKTRFRLASEFSRTALGKHQDHILSLKKDFKEGAGASILVPILTQRGSFSGDTHQVSLGLLVPLYSIF